MRSEIFRHLQRMHIGFFDHNPVGRLVTRLTSDVDALNEMFTSGVFAIFEDVFVLAGIVAVMLKMSWWLALISFSVLPLIFLITRVFRKHVRDSYRRIRTAIARINAFTQEHVSGMSVVQLFGRERRSYADFKDINGQHMEAFKGRHSGLCALLSRGRAALFSCHRADPSGLADAACCAAPSPWACWSPSFNTRSASSGPSRTSARSTTFCRPPWPPASASSSCSTPRLRSPRRQRFRPMPPVDAVTPAASSFAMSGLPTSGSARTTRPPSPAASHADLEAMSVEWILRGVSFTVAPDQTAAIVGHTGAGKTTIISLMMRFYDVQRGQVLIDDVDVREQDLTTLRQRFGVVLQDPFLFTGTIAENIRLGTTSITDETHAAGRGRGQRAGLH